MMSCLAFWLKWWCVSSFADGEADYMCRYTAVTERGGFEEFISERKRRPFARANHFHCVFPLRDLAFCFHLCFTRDDVFLTCSTHPNASCLVTTSENVCILRGLQGFA